MITSLTSTFNIENSFSSKYQNIELFYVFPQSEDFFVSWAGSSKIECRISINRNFLVIDPS